jgi:hypothetical protein
MDARKMIAALSFTAAGLLAGLLYFALLRWNTALYLGGGGLATAAFIQIARLAAVAGFLALAAQYGALPLLLTALGVLIARPLVTRWIP